MATATRKGAARSRAKKKQKGGVKGRSWNWGHTNTLVLDTKKWTKDARLRLPAPKDSVLGCVFAAMEKLKKASDDELQDECEKMGLGKITRQQPRKQVQVKLRRLRRWGVVARDKHTKKARRRRERERGKVVEKRTEAAAPAKSPVAARKRPAAKPNAAVPAPPATKAVQRPVKVAKPPARPNRPVRTAKPATAHPKANGGVPKTPKVAPPLPPAETPAAIAVPAAASEPPMMEQGTD